MSHKLEAKVKDSYNMGPIVAFSGHEYIRNEWRPVPVGFEPAAIVHPMLDVRDAKTEKEIRVTAKDHLAEIIEPPVSVETPEAPVEEEKKPASKRSSRSSRRSKASTEDR